MTLGFPGSRAWTFVGQWAQVPRSSADDTRDMDVMRTTRRWSRMTILGTGTAAGLVFALPVKTGSVSCPPANEGRAYCLVQHAWAPAFVKVAAAALVAWLLADLLFTKLPAMRHRRRTGERIGGLPADLGREAVLGDSVLAAATWGVVPEPKQPVWKVVKPTPSPAVAALFARMADEAAARPVPPVEPVADAPAPVAKSSALTRLLAEAGVEAEAPAPVAEPEPEPVAEDAEVAAPEADEAEVAAPVAAEAPEPEVVADESRAPAPSLAYSGVRALTAADRAARRHGVVTRQVRVLTDADLRGRRLRRGNDSALLVSCWSYASSAKALPDDAGTAALGGVLS